MESGKKEYTFFWFIENYSYCWHKNGEKLISPPFTAEGLEGTAWDIQLYPKGLSDKYKGRVSLFLNRSAIDDGPESYSISCELAVLAADGSLLRFLKYEYAFKKGEDYGFRVFLEKDEIFLRKMTDYLPQDVLTVRCKIWKSEGEVVRNIGQSSARTRIRVEKISFLHEVQNFSALETKQKKSVEIRPHSKEEHFISSSLHITDCSCCEEKIAIEIAPSDADQILRKCDLYLLDASGNVKECGKADNRYDIELKSITTLHLSLTKEAVLNSKSEFLPDDKFSLLCNCTFSRGIEFQTIEETAHEMPLALMQKTNDVLRKNTCRASEKNSYYPNGLEDIKDLYTDKSLTDVQLKTKTKSFPVHKIVLCARSPVFKRMLTNDMKEKNSNCIEIGDLGDDVVQQLLLFLYSDTVENLQWGMATQLYYAADKYEVGRLKAVCSSFLLENLTPTNAGELLLLADTHSDGDLKKLTEDFILEHEKEVFGSKEWEKLMETNPLLAMKAMHLKYKR
ncbi:unnamed protein product [Larinioides sclopetarius]|uniref:Speckle-type POZ protein n=1 Tax=Larinioides sclopetarius TaxID=280406 RepID=A0AAV2AZ59_9ARAC